MLVWKEWRERRLQFLVCSLWMIGGTIYTIACERSHGYRVSVASFFGMAGTFGLFVPIFLAMRTSLGETTARTRSFSSALPVSPSQRSWIRLAGGAGVLVAPILLGALLLSLCLALGWLEQVPAQSLGDNQVPLQKRASLSPFAAVGLLWQVTIVAVWSATTLYILLSLVGTTLRAEAHAGYVGAFVAILWCLGDGLQKCLPLDEVGLPGLAEWAGSVIPEGMLSLSSYGDKQGIVYSDLRIANAVFGPLVVNTVIQFVLAAWFVRRNSRRLPGRLAKKWRMTSPASWVPWSLPLPTRSLALVWLTLRQSVPMCLPGLLLACLITPLMTPLMDDSPAEQGELLRRLSDAMHSSMAVVGMLWATVVGAGLFSTEIDWRIGEFWRVWPVPFRRMFAIKFLVGLLVVLLVLDGTTIAASWNSPYWGTYCSMNWPYIACILPLHAVMFAVAVGWTCLLRRPVFGGIATIISFTFVNVLFGRFSGLRHFDPIDVYNNLAYGAQAAGGRIDLTAHNYPVVAAGMAVILLASLLIGGLALRRYAPVWESK
jgi:hypothetical protein